MARFLVGTQLQPSVAMQLIRDSGINAYEVSPFSTGVGGFFLDLEVNSDMSTSRQEIRRVLSKVRGLEQILPMPDAEPG
jgi:hypothetical protein